jgi:LuxR family maltose regulon positive regulatory protein
MERYGPGMPVYRPVLGELVRIDLGGEAGPAGGGAMARQAGGRTGDLIEPLTERELTVLRYLQETLSNVEIASILYVSVNTVKTHVKNIYRKLQAGRRREAVQRARQLRLL